MRRIVAAALAAAICFALCIPCIAFGSAPKVEWDFSYRVTGEVVDIRSVQPLYIDSGGRVALKDGRYVKWIDRLDLEGADYAKEFYEWLLENTSAEEDTVAGALANPIYSGYAASGDVVDLGGGYYAHPVTDFSGTVLVSYEEGSTEEETKANAAAAVEAKLSTELNAQFREAATYAFAVYQALDRDEMGNFWLDGSAQCGYGCEYSFSYSDGFATASYRNTVYFYLKTPEFDIRAQEYRSTTEADGEKNPAAAEEKSRMTAFARESVMKALPFRADTYETLKHFHDYLTKANCYNTAEDLNNIPDRCRTAQAIFGYDGTNANAPVCEGYARAFKYLCDMAGIPCVLVDGTALSERHMWNYVQMEDGLWYAVDVTWDDPTVVNRQTGEVVTDAVSGAERKYYFLVGADTRVEGHYFINSHPVSNRAAVGGTCFVNGPELTSTKYVYSGDKTPDNACGEDLAWTFDEAAGLLSISGNGDMWAFDNGTPWDDICHLVTELVVEPGVESVGSGAFSGCTALKKVSLPYDIELPKETFALCTLEELEISGLPEGAAAILAAYSGQRMNLSQFAAAQEGRAYFSLPGGENGVYKIFALSRESYALSSFLEMLAGSAE